MTIDEVLASATIEQKRYTIARLTHNKKESCRIAQVHHTSIYRWGNLEDLEWCVEELLTEQVKAAGMVLSESAIDAAEALKKSLHDRAYRVRAAEAILDRVGLGTQSNISVNGEVEIALSWDDNDQSPVTEST